MIPNNSGVKEDLKEKYLSSIIEETYSDNNTMNQIHNNNKNKNNNNNTFRRNIKTNNVIKKKLMMSLLKTMNKNAYINLNNINSINFIYQAFGKGLNMINNNQDKNLNNLNKTEKIINCMENHKFYRNLDTNKFYKTNIISLYPTENKKVNIFNSTDKILRNKNNLNNKKKFLDKKQTLKRSYSCCIKNSKNNQQKNNFALLPIKNILLKKTIENFERVPVIKHKLRTSIIYKKKKVLEEEKEKLFRENLKIFSYKYEKEKEDFNNILFDEFTEFRKKKFRLESFIKKFTNKHFVEKLFIIKEIANQKCQ